jgi:pyruvate,water dikinase
MFVNTPLPPDRHKLLKEELETYFTGKSVVVRSSAPGEDSSETSFAGLHESYVNVRGNM